MSRIGKKVIVRPKGVQIKVESGLVTVKGPKGEISQKIDPALEVDISDTEINVRRPSEERRIRAQHGLARTLIQNMVTGVTTGFTKTLQIIGVGYRATQQGQGLQFQLGYSHPIDIEPIPGIEFEVQADNRAKTNFVLVRGVDKQKVGQVAANLRGLRPPEPYKGKGVRYVDEVIIKKMGKAGKAGK